MSDFNVGARKLTVLSGWLPRLQEVFDHGIGRVQSSVRPVDAVEMAAGPAGIREQGPIPAFSAEYARIPVR
jgi:hypothetical protein